MKQHYYPNFTNDDTEAVKFKQLAEGHVATKWQPLDLNSRLLVPHLFFYTKMSVLHFTLHDQPYIFDNVNLVNDYDFHI